MTRYVTNGELQTYKDCKRKWWLGWHRRLRPLARSYVGAAELGTVVHKCLEVGAKEDRSPAEVLASDVRPELEGTCPPGERDALEKQLELARIMLEGFEQWRAEEGLDAGYVVLGVEARAEAQLPGTDVTLMGKLDRVTRRTLDGTILLEDYKTVGSIEVGGIGQNEQFKHYALILRLLGVGAGGARRIMLRKVKRTAKANPPFYGVDEVWYTDRTLELYMKQLYGEVEDVLESEAKLDRGADPGRIMYPRPNRDCSWKCEFAGVCPMFDDGKSDPEGALRVAFEQGDPLDRYKTKDVK